MSGHVASLNAAAAGTVILYEALRQRRRDAAPPDTRTARPAAPLQIPEDAADDAEFAEGEEDVVLEAETPDVMPVPGQELPESTSIEDETGDVETVEATAPVEKPAPKKRVTRPRAKKKTDD
jgi:ribonuclease E